MSLKTDLKAKIDLEITNEINAGSIAPSEVGGNMKSIIDITAPPIGSIIMYHPVDLSEFDVSGLGIADNVKGYAICNGNNNTPNLKGRFIVGYDSSDTDYNIIGKLGGLKSVILSLLQIPSHTHTTSTVPSTSGSRWPFQAGPGYTTVNENTGSAGGGQAHENRPPYYTLLYIKRIN